MRASAPVLLAVDTSTRVVGIALYDGAQVLGESVWSSNDYHTVELAPAVAQLLKKCALDAQHLEALAAALGPGSFTGLRIGLALVKGLALARRIPLVGIPTLDVLAFAQPVTGEHLAAVARAGRGRLAVGWYQAEAGAWRPNGEVSVLTVEQLSELIPQGGRVCGELTLEERQFLESVHGLGVLTSPALSLRRPSFLAELAWKRWQSGQVADPATLAPLYLHYQDAIPAA